MITTDLENEAQAYHQIPRLRYRKAATAFFPYAVWQEQSGDPRMVDAFLGVAVSSDIEVVTLGSIRFMWGAIRPFVTTLFDEASPNSVNRVIALVSPYVLWDTQDFKKSAVTRWVAAALAVPYTEVVGQSVVDALLQVASVDSLRPHIPIRIWAWLNKQPSLPRICFGRSKGTKGDVVYWVRALGDIEILKSYFLLVWSECDSLYDSGFTEMCTSIREDFGGIGMGCHREDLIKQLSHVQRQLDRGLKYLQEHVSFFLTGSDILVRKMQYGKLKEVLLEVDGEALEILTRMPFRLTNPSDLLTTVDIHRIPLNICLCTPSPMSIAVCMQHLLFVSQLCTLSVCVFYPLCLPSIAQLFVQLAQERQGWAVLCWLNTALSFF